MSAKTAPSEGVKGNEEKKSTTTTTTTTPPPIKRTGTINRHDVAKFVITLMVVCVGPVFGYQHQLIERQSEAMKWPGVPCYIHDSDSRDASGDRRSLYKSNNEFKPLIHYTYTYKGVNRTSTQVYYYGKRHPGRPEAQINKILAFYTAGKQTLAFVNPENPSESVLIQEVSFTPYGWLLFEIALLLAALWYFILEHDWASTSDLPTEYKKVSKNDTLTDATPEDVIVWYHLPTHYGIRSSACVMSSVLIAVAWHIGGHQTWQAYIQHRTAPTGNELRFLFHILGIILAIRSMYFIVFASRLQDFRLLIDKKRIEMGSPFTLRFEQPRRSTWIPVEYEKVALSFELIETFQGPRQGQGPNRQVKRLHSEKLDILQGYKLGSGSLGVSCISPFDLHVCQLQGPPDIHHRNRYYYRWVVDVNIFIKWSPVSYHLPIQVACFVPEELRPRVDTTSD